MEGAALKRILPLRNTEMWINRGRQTIPEIMTEVINAHEYYVSDYDLLAEYFDKRDLVKTFIDLFDTCKKNLVYREEKEKLQNTKSPAWIFKDGIGDCKHYASFIGGVLGALQRSGRKFDWGYCFASYDPQDKMPGHVFVMAEFNGTWYWIDPVLSYFDQRDIKPDHKIFKRPKSNAMALRRVGAVNDFPDATIELDQADRSLDPDLLAALQLLYRYNILGESGAINDQLLVSYHGQIPMDDFQRLSQARVLIQKAAVNGLFDTIWRGIKKVTLFAPRNAYLGLVGLNAFGYATKLKAALWDKNGNYTPFKDQLKKIWQDRLGGDWTNLENTIQRGAQKKAILKGMTVGVAPAVIPAWVTTAAAVVAAIMPLVNAFLKKAQVDGDPNIMLDQSMYPYGICSDGITPRNADGSCASSGSGGGIGNFIEQNPVLVLVGVGGLIYFLTKKKR